MACLNNDKDSLGSQFFITTAKDIKRFDGVYTVFGEIFKGLDVLNEINNVYCDKQGKPYQNIRIRHTTVIFDPWENDLKYFNKLEVTLFNKMKPEQSPEPEIDKHDIERIRDDEELYDKDKTEQQAMDEINELNVRTDKKILVMVNDIPDEDIRPPDNVLFVCKLNPITQDSDLKAIFSEHGKIVDCTIIRDWKTGDSLQYAFIEYENKQSCEEAFLNKNAILIDERRIKVDFSQSVSHFWRRFKKNGKFVKQNDSNNNNNDRNNSNSKSFKHYDNKYQKPNHSKHNKHSRHRSKHKKRDNYSRKYYRELRSISPKNRDRSHKKHNRHRHRNKYKSSDKRRISRSRSRSRN